MHLNIAISCFGAECSISRCVLVRRQVSFFSHHSRASCSHWLRFYLVMFPWIAHTHLPFCRRKFAFVAYDINWYSQNGSKLDPLWSTIETETKLKLWDACPCGLQHRWTELLDPCQLNQSLPPENQKLRSQRVETKRYLVHHYGHLKASPKLFLFNRETRPCWSYTI